MKTLLQIGGLVPKVGTLLRILIGLLLFDVLARINSGPFKAVGVLALLMLPGYGLLRFLLKGKVEKISFLLMSVGLSVLEIITLGLAVNAMILLFGFNSSETSVAAMLLADIALVPGLAKLDLPKVDLILNWLKTSWVTLLVSVALVSCTIIGAIRLNNNGSSIIAIISTIAVLIYIVYFAARSGDGRTKNDALTLFAASLSVSLGIWLRSWYVSGVDETREFGLYNYIVHMGYWSPHLFNNAYNACLSITVLPQMLHLVLSLDGSLIFKLLMPSLCSLIPVTIFVFCRSLFPRSVAYLSGAFFAVQPVVFSGFLLPLRQQVAFLFLSLFCLVMLSNQLSARAKGTLLLIFGTGLIVSHYSTAYIFILILIGLYVALRLMGRKFTYLSLRTIGLFLIMVFFWYAQFGTGFKGAVSYATTSIENLGQIFSSDVQNQGSSFMSNFEIFTGTPTNTATVAGYFEGLEHGLRGIKFASPHAASVNSPKSSGNPLLARVLKFIGNGFIFVIPIISALGLWQFWKDHKQEGMTDQSMVFAASALSCLSIYVVFLLLPYISINYDLSRLHQQLLIILCAVALLGLRPLSRLFRMKDLLVPLYFVGFFVFASGLVQQGLGGDSVSIRYNNSGLAYAEFYTQTGDTLGAKWLATRVNATQNVSADSYASDRLSLDLAPAKASESNPNIVTAEYFKDTTIYTDSINNVQSVGLISYKGPTLSYRFPSSVISQTHDLIYTNGVSKIY